MGALVNRARLRRLARARPKDLVEAAAVLSAAARVEWSLRRHTLPATAGILGVALFAGEVPSDGAPTSPDRLDLPAWAWRRTRIAFIIMRRWPFGDTCLRRALVIGNRLAPLAPELVIGVRSNSVERGFDAHAWLRIDGVDLDPLAVEYLAFGAS